jgi:hypothetical protein
MEMVVKNIGNDRDLNRLVRKGQKKAQIKIQAVAKIQYPIKSHSSYCKT